MGVIKKLAVRAVTKINMSMSDAGLSKSGISIFRLIRVVYKLLRISHWVKNSLVFAPLIFSENLFNLELFTKSVSAFFLFCSAASGIYIINDILDREKDKLHPQKRNRPITSGIVTVKIAFLVAAILLLTSIFVSWSIEPVFSFVIMSYIGLELAYMLKLKNVVILDALSVSAGLVLRVIGGILAIQVPESSWLYICVGSLALFLAFAKRRSELQRLEKQAPDHRGVLLHYNPYYLAQMMTVTITVTLGVYLLYILNPETVATFGSLLGLTIPFVFYGIFRYQYLIYHRTQDTDDPIENLLFDMPLLSSCFLWVLSVVLVIYL